MASWLQWRMPNKRKSVIGYTVAAVLGVWLLSGLIKSCTTALSVRVAHETKHANNNFEGDMSPAARCALHCAATVISGADAAANRTVGAAQTFCERMMKASCAAKAWQHELILVLGIFCETHSRLLDARPCRATLLLLIRSQAGAFVRATRLQLCMSQLCGDDAAFLREASCPTCLVHDCLAALGTFLDASHWSHVAVNPVRAVLHVATAEDCKFIRYQEGLQVSHPLPSPSLAMVFTPFKEISFAYEVLSNPERRREYDEKGDRLFYTGPPSSPEELAEMLLRGSSLGAGRRKSKDRFVALPVSLESLTDLKKYLNYKKKVLETASKAHHVQEELTVFIERGLEVGDLIVVLHELEHPRFRRRDADLFMKLDISLAEALVGFKRVIQHLDGRRRLRGEPMELAGPCVKAMKEQGMPLKGRPFSYGNLFLEINVCFPEKLDVAVISLLDNVLPRTEHLAETGEVEVYTFEDADPFCHDLQASCGTGPRVF
ncbi:DNAJ1 [Symbiodinium natans]|uniref:DNAJ1 protein n=1 Tax=Symbiodinium natans TaxID=878477 RepID=A0A812GNW2_9DINO|nr:DNAJ1 [Symbiodinium natans]